MWVGGEDLEMPHKFQSAFTVRLSIAMLSIFSDRMFAQTLVQQSPAGLPDLFSAPSDVGVGLQNVLWYRKNA